MEARTIEYLSYIAEAEVALNRNDETSCVEHLRRGLAVGRAQRFVNHTWWSSKIMARLYAVALRHGVEEEYVHEVMRLRGMSTDNRGQTMNRGQTPISPSP